MFIYHIEAFVALTLLLIHISINVYGRKCHLNPFPRLDLSLRLMA